MMLKILLLTVSVGLVWSTRPDKDWEAFKAKHQKSYASDEEEGNRRANWEANMDAVDKHNQGGHSFSLSENEFSDMSNEEFTKTMNGARPPASKSVGSDFHYHIYYITGSTAAPETTPSSDLPDTVDWRTKGYVTTVKNQGQCGCCWSFSAAGSLEGALFKSTGKLVNLSESNLIDCSSSYGNHGCNGGWYGNAFSYVMQNGIASLVEYPFVPQQQTCKYTSSMSVTKASTYKSVQAGEEYLKRAVATVGPVSVAIDASLQSFQLYSSGVYIDSSCTSKLDHAVLVVGYGTDNGQDYWLVKNSWGTTWGEDGYIKMARNLNDQCGIASAAEYPIV